jgi:hypothetical protein
MKKTLFSLIFILFGVNSAQAAEPSDESVIQLLILQEVDKAPAQVKAQLDELTAATVNQVEQSHFFLSAAEKAAVKTFQEKSLAVSAELDARLDFDKLKPVYLKIYKDHFTQEEVDQLIALYQTPAGKLLAAKMPLVSQESSNLLQQNVTPLFLRMRQAASEMKQQIDASHAK